MSRPIISVPDCLRCVWGRAERTGYSEYYALDMSETYVVGSAWAGSAWPAVHGRQCRQCMVPCVRCKARLLHGDTGIILND